MQKYATVAGILSIVSGGIGILWGLFWTAFSIFFSVVSTGLFSMPGITPPPPEVFPFFQFFSLIWTLYIVMGVITVLLGIVGIIGGVFALKKRHWGWALAGAIASVIAFFPCGIAAVIMISLAQPEFSVSKTTSLAG
jgi:hypothetical protein